MLDIHTLTDIAALIVAVVGGYLAGNRMLGDRLATAEKTIAIHDQVLRNCGFLK